MAERRFRVLIVEDEESLRRIARHELEGAGYGVAVAADGKAGLEAFLEQGADAVLTDVRMPGLSGTELCDEILRHSPDTPVVLMTGHGTVREAVAAMRRGVADYFTKPVDWEEVLVVLDRVFEHRRLRQENERLRANLRTETRFDRILGDSPPMRALFATMQRLLEVDSSVLIEGESGTGKELVARALHFQGRRASGPFVALNCAAIPPDLCESQLFGHLKGAFSGAHAAQRGAFAEASGGTLLLDEIGELPLATQPKLLRALAERSITPIGSSSAEAVDVRVIAATNRNLEQAVTEGEFREDLYYRLAVVPLRIPPLRDRGDDVLLIAREYLSRDTDHPRTLSDDAEASLLSSAWHGNVRELLNSLERACVLAADPERIEASDLPAPSTPCRPALDRILAGEFPTEGLDLAQLERLCIQGALARADQNQTRAAALLGITRQTLIYRMAKYGLKDSAPKDR